MSYRDASPQYWNEYTNIQKVKHDLIREYLKGWFPKVGFTSERLIYLDTHAGRGRHAQGELGSPLIAMRTILEHGASARILQRCKVHMRFIERDEENHKALLSELSSIPQHPQVDVRGRSGDCYKVLGRICDWLEDGHGQKWAPAFVFVDPYGFKIPADDLRRLLKFRGTELFVNVMWRELDMAIQQGPDSPLAPTLDSVFGSNSWNQLVGMEGLENRAERCVELLRDGYGAKWATSFRMLGGNGRTRYILLHLSNHQQGRDLMKHSMWKVCPHGGFYARKSDSSAQELLIEPVPNLEPLDLWILERCANPRRWSELTASLRETLWLERHLTERIKALAKAGRLTAVDGSRRLLKKQNPLLVAK